MTERVLMNSSGCVGDCIAKGEDYQICAKKCMPIDVKKIKAIEESTALISPIIKISEVATAVSEKNQIMNITSVEIKAIKVNETQMIQIPVAIPEEGKLKEFVDVETGVEIKNKTISIPMKDEFGAKVATLIAKTDDVTGMGPVAVAAVKEVKLEVEERTVELKAPIAAPRVAPATPKISISVDLKELPEENASIKVKDVNVSAPGVNLTLQKFENITKQMNLSIKSKGVIVQIEKTKLVDQKDIKSATVKVKVAKEWVNENGGIDKVRMLREGDDGISEMLNATFSGEEDGNYIFEAKSPKGLSLYALVTVEYMPPSEEKKLPIDIVLVGIAAVIILGGMAILFLGRKR